MLELFNTEDRVAEEVVQAHALLEAAAVRVGQAEAGVREANITLAGTRIGLRQPLPAGGVMQLVNRPQEAVAALQQLNRAYDTYFCRRQRLQPGAVPTLSGDGLSRTNRYLRPPAWGTSECGHLPAAVHVARLPARALVPLPVGWAYCPQSANELRNIARQGQFPSAGFAAVWQSARFCNRRVEWR